MEEDVYRVMFDVEERHWWFRGRRAVIDALLDRVDGRTAPVLDVGCGAGRNLQLYARLGSAHGVDPSSRAVEFCRLRGLENVTVGTADALPFEPEQFGLVAATDVLEHVPEPGAALAEMARVAAPGATLLLTVPAYGWLWSDEDERLGHYRRYTLAKLRAEAAAAGWEPAAGTYFNTLMLAPIALARRLARQRRGNTSELERTPRWADGLLSLPMRAEARWIRSGMNLTAGVSIGLVCQRPGASSARGSSRAT